MRKINYGTKCSMALDAVEAAEGRTSHNNVWKGANGMASNTCKSCASVWHRCALHLSAMPIAPTFHRRSGICPASLSRPSQWVPCHSQVNPPHTPGISGSCPLCLKGGGQDHVGTAGDAEWGVNVSHCLKVGSVAFKSIQIPKMTRCEICRCPLGQDT